MLGAALILLALAGPALLASARPALRAELRRGERYLRLNGAPAFLLGRNPTELSVGAFESRFREAEAAGERLMRLHLMHGIPPGRGPGEIDEEWARRWESVFDAAARRGIAVIPVFTVWAQWNDGSGGELWHVWNDNPYNAARGGPARSPADVLGDTPCRRAWLRWLGNLVRRWRGRTNIAAWEPISELDLVTGSSPAAGAGFIAAAAATIRAADTGRRPITVSLSGIHDWPELFRSPAVDIVQAHPYAIDAPWAGRLADEIIAVTRERLARYGKPVLLGECGLDWRPPPGTLTQAERAPVGIRQAIWAAAVSGAISGRMLWWEDGYDRYERGDASARCGDVAAPVARFAREVAWRDLRPAAALCPPEIRGAALAGAVSAIGWFRDALCDPPTWPERPLTGLSVTLSINGSAAAWRVRFYDALTGEPTGETLLRSAKGRLTIPLPPFRGSIALQATRAR